MTCKRPAGRALVGILLLDWSVNSSAYPSTLPPIPHTQTSKPSLHDLMARKSVGPKKLQEVRVNPAIASAFAGDQAGAPACSTPRPVRPACTAQPHQPSLGLRTVTVNSPAAGEMPPTMPRGFVSS